MHSSVTAGAVIYTADFDRLAASYIVALGFRECERKPDYVVLEDGTVQLVLPRTDTAAHSPTAGAAALARPANAGPAPRRSEAAIKPVFQVASIEAARTAAPSVGGRINAARHEWRFGAHRVAMG